jgi:hypothetical protein
MVAVGGGKLPPGMQAERHRIVARKLNRASL